jgi:hypothetical protein
VTIDPTTAALAALTNVFGPGFQSNIAVETSSGEPASHQDVSYLAQTFGVRLGRLPEQRTVRSTSPHDEGLKIVFVIED